MISDIKMSVSSFKEKYCSKLSIYVNYLVYHFGSQKQTQLKLLDYLIEILGNKGCVSKLYNILKVYLLRNDKMILKEKVINHNKISS